jgi:hypothetical protein
MRTLVRVALAALVVMLTSTAPRADIVSVSGRAQLADSDAPNRVGLGVRATVQALMFEGYWDYLGHGNDGSVRRAILGVRTDLGVSRVSVTLRAGLGAIRDTRGALGGTDVTGARSGFAGRAGAGAEAELGYGLRVGFSLDAEAYLVTASERSFRFDTTDAGTSYVGALYLEFRLGI